MTASKINQLAWYLPVAEPEDTAIGMHDYAELQHYLKAYRNLSFGWDFVLELAKNKIAIPTILDGNDLWVWRAYHYVVNKTDDWVIRSALQVHIDEGSHRRNTMESLLLDPRADVSYISEKLNLPKDVIYAYEKLFYNILDRRTDSTFIAEVVYPDGRIVEMFDDYLQQEGLGSLLKRAGYNNGSADVLYFAGISNDTLSALAGTGTSAQLESLLMANGLVLARNGWSNQRHHAVGINHTRQLMQAAKQGGQEEGIISHYQSVGSSLMNEMEQFASSMENRQLSFQRGDQVLPEGSYSIPVTVDAVTVDV